MTAPEIEARKIAAHRLRRTLYWRRRRGEKPTPEILQEFLRTGLWREMGYKRLLDCLKPEFEIMNEPAADLVMQAINMGVEDERLYGLEGVHGQTAGQAGNDSKSGGGEGVGDSGIAAAGSRGQSRS